MACFSDNQRGAGNQERAWIILWKILENSGIKWKIILTFALNISGRVQGTGSPVHIHLKHWEMVKFIGEYTVRLDDKGRLVFPSAFKNMLPAGKDMKFVVKKDIFEDCLEMYTFSEWERQSEEVKSKLNFFNRRHAAFWREYMRDRAIVEPDSKIGRITIPKPLLESIGAGKDVVFSGNDFKIEIWAKEKYGESVLPADEFVSVAESLPGMDAGH